jgi:hypothetical protein
LTTSVDKWTEDPKSVVVDGQGLQQRRKSRVCNKCPPRIMPPIFCFPSRRDHFLETPPTARRKIEKNSCEKSSLCSSFENETTTFSAVVSQGQLCRPTTHRIPLGSPFTQRGGSVYPSMASKFLGGTTTVQPDGILTSPEQHSRPTRLPFSGTGALFSFATPLPHDLSMSLQLWLVHPR